MWLGKLKLIDAYRHEKVTPVCPPDKPSRLEPDRSEGFPIRIQQGFVRAGAVAVKLALGTLRFVGHADRQSPIIAEQQ